jgi:hypothetical protein
LRQKLLTTSCDLGFELLKFFIREPMELEGGLELGVEPGNVRVFGLLREEP